MDQPAFGTFPSEVITKLNFYVYRLIDPRNGETFYVGKGKGNRVFSHAKGMVNSQEEELEPKLKRIAEIQGAGFEVAHVIHRHGMEEKTAIEVEAAVIDAYPGLTNIAGGAGSSDFGVMHSKEIIARYRAEPAAFKHRAILINVNNTAGEIPLYEATRYSWKIGSKAEQAEVVLAVKQGLIVGAFKAEQWLPATPENFPGRTACPGRRGFVGTEASAEIKRQYVGKRVPDEYRKKGASNPIKYTWQKEAKGAKPSDWTAESLPAKRTTIRLDRAFSQQEMKRIRAGLVPEQMEDKWFIYWKDGELFFHRSWTGYCIYVVRFAEEGGQFRMIEADVNRDPEQYQETSVDRDAEMIQELVNSLLLTDG